MSKQIISEKNFDPGVIQSKLPVLLDFWAPWCGYCRRLMPAVDALSAELAKTLAVGTINIDEEPALAKRFFVDTIPTLILFKDGQAIGKPLVAPDSKAAVEDWLTENGVVQEGLV